MTKIRTEDPVRIRAFLNSVSQLSWADEASIPSLRALFNSTTALAEAEVRYYFGKRQGSKWISRTIRLFAWLLGGAGILVPLVHPLWGDTAPKAFLSWGYLSFGVAGIVLVADNLFAGSPAHQRYVSAQLNLEKHITVFGIEWQGLLASYEREKKTEQLLALIDKAAMFAKAMHESLSLETMEWQKNVAEALADLKNSASKGQTH